MTPNEVIMLVMPPISIYSLVSISNSENTKVSENLSILGALEIMITLNQFKKRHNASNVGYFNPLGIGSYDK